MTSHQDSGSWSQLLRSQSWTAVVHNMLRTARDVFVGHAVVSCMLDRPSKGFASEDLIHTTSIQPTLSAGKDWRLELHLPRGAPVAAG